MLEIFLLVGATSAIAAYARGRGGSPWLWGTITVVGYLGVELGVAVMWRFVTGETNPLPGLLGSWAWVGAVALYTRFGLGAARPKPWGMWTCPNCKYLNGGYALICEACKQPYADRTKGGPARH